MTKEPAFESLAEILMGIFIHGHGERARIKRSSSHRSCNDYNLFNGCGWLSQTKANSDEYTQGSADRFRKLIVDAFEIGQKYSKDQP